MAAEGEEITELIHGLEEEDGALGADRGPEEITSKELLEEAERTLENETEIDEVDVKDREDYEGGVKDGKNETIEDIKEGKPVPKIQNIWESAKKFGKWVGIEVGKGAAFAVGMNAVEKLFKKEASKTKSPTDNKRLKIISAITKATKDIKPKVDDWLLWIAKHQNNRDKYGEIAVVETTINRLQILQEKLGSLTVFCDSKVTPAMIKAVKIKDVATAKNLLEQNIHYIQKCLDISQWIQTDGEKPMVSDGLQNHHADFEQAKKDLEDVKANA